MRSTVSNLLSTRRMADDSLMNELSSLIFERSFPASWAESSPELACKLLDQEQFRRNGRQSEPQD